MASASITGYISLLRNWTVTFLSNFSATVGSNTFTDQSPLAHTISAQGSAVAYGSVYSSPATSVTFDGSWDSLTVPHHSGFDFGSGDFTIGLSVRIAATSTSYYNLMAHDQIGGTRGWLLIKDSSSGVVNTVVFTAWVGGTSYSVSDPVALTAGGQHTDYVITRSGGTLTMYRNGVSVATTSISGSIGNPAEPLAFGLFRGVGTFIDDGHLNGSIDDAIIVKGAALTPTALSVLRGTKYQHQVLSDSPVAYYRLSDISGTTAFNRAIGGTNGTYSGTYTLAQTGMTLDSGSKSVLFSDAAIDCGFSTLGNVGSLEAIFKPLAGSGVHGQIVGHVQFYSATGNDFPIKVFFSPSDNKVCLSIDNGGNYTTDHIISSPELSLGSTYHVVATWSYSAGTAKLYVNGTEVASASISGSIATGGGNWRIGKSIEYGGGVGKSKFSGYISDVAIYTTQLSGARVAEHYAALS